MNTNVAQARMFLAPYIEGGVCEDDPRVLTNINEAQQRLIAKPWGAQFLHRCIRMCTHGNCLTLPRGIEKIVKCRIDGVTQHAFSSWYEFAEGGPGLADSDSSGWVDPIDKGLVCTTYDIHKPMRIAMLSDTEDDANTICTIRGFDETGREVRNNAAGMGEDLKIGYKTIWYSQASYSKIYSVQKPRTKGYCFFFLWDPDTAERFDLSTYHPDELMPRYRRFVLKGFNFEENREDPEPSWTETPTGTVWEPKTYLATMLVKMAFIPVYHDTDILLISNLSALKIMCQAIKYYNAGDPEKGLAYEKIAEEILLQELSHYNIESGSMDIQVAPEFSMGDIEPL